MSLSVPRQFFGIHSVAPYSRTDGTFYGILKVLGSSALSISGSIVEVFGGSSVFSWAAETGQIKAEMNLKPKEYPDFLFTLFFGVAPVTTLTPDTAGTLGALTNKKGASLMSATTGVASIGIVSAGGPKLAFGKYTVVVVSATTVDVYASTDIDFGVKGQGLAFQTDALKITATALTITASTPVTIPNTGIQLTGGSGTIGMTTGDTATFTVQPPSTKQTQVTVGSKLNVFPEFGAIIMGQRRSSGELVEIDCFRCKAIGFPIGFDEIKWSETDIKATVLYDSVQDAVMGIRTVAES